MTPKKKNILLIYASIATFGLLLLITGYSFSIDLFDYLLVGTLILTPVVILILHIKKTSIRIVVSVLLFLIFSFIGFVLLVWSGFSSSHPEMIKTWTVDEYRIELTHRQAWAGPPYYQFDLKSVLLFGLFEKTIDSHPCSSCKDNCIIEFTDSKKQIKIFNQCQGTLDKSDNKD